jgi:hypothetical protein
MTANIQFWLHGEREFSLILRSYDLASFHGFVATHLIGFLLPVSKAVQQDAYVRFEFHLDRMISRCIWINLQTAYKYKLKVIYNHY